MNLLGKKSLTASCSIKKLEFHNYDLIFGGGYNDCICSYVDVFHGNRVTMIGHHDVDTEQTCAILCCSSNFPGSYQYKSDRTNVCHYSCSDYNCSIARIM